jgi:hypothetical protein
MVMKHDLGARFQMNHRLLHPIDSCPRLAAKPCTLLLLLIVCFCGSACQVRIPAAPSVTPTTGEASSSSDPLAAAVNDGREPQAPVLPDDTAGSQPEIPSEPAEEARQMQQDSQAVPITFDDLKLEMEKDTVYDSTLLTERVKELDGRRVRIRGFLYPGVFQQTGITQFPLIKNTQCKFGPGGQAHHIVLVELKHGLTTSFTVRPIAVEGVLTLQPWTGPDGNTWALYHMVGEDVE